jgi:hypothetical protein
LRIRKGHRLYAANLDFGHVDAVRDSYPQFEDLRNEHGNVEVGVSAGRARDFDLAMFTLGLRGALRHRQPFTETTLREIHGVRAIAGSETVFQIEVPVQLVLLAKAPSRVRSGLATVLSRSITGLAAAAPSGTRFAVHLCLGDMNNRAFGTMRDVGPLVLLANAITSTWPAERRLEVLHAPFAAADHPATTDARFHEPLTELRLDPGVRFAAGFAHEAQELSRQREIRDLIESRLAREVMIAAACGLGRRDEATGRANLERTAALCAD